jgi:hypothetical protein
MTAAAARLTPAEVGDGHHGAFRRDSAGAPRTDLKRRPAGQVCGPTRRWPLAPLTLRPPAVTSRCSTSRQRQPVRSGLGGRAVLGRRLARTRARISSKANGFLGSYWTFLVHASTTSGDPPFGVPRARTGRLFMNVHVEHSVQPACGCRAGHRCVSSEPSPAHGLRRPPRSDRR